MNNLKNPIALHSTLFFFLIFGWKITPLIDLSVIVAIPVYIFALTRYDLTLSTIKLSAPFSAAIAVLVSYCIANYILNDPNSPQWTLRTIRASISFGAIFILVNLQLSDELDGRKIVLKAIAIAITLHAIITISSQLHPLLRHYLYSMTQAHLYVNETTIIQDNRSLGLTYSLSITSTLYFFACAIIMKIQPKQLASRFIKLAAIGLNVVACLWVARTGLAFFPLLLVLLIHRLEIKNPKQLTSNVGSAILFFAVAFLVALLEPVQNAMLFPRTNELLTFLSFSEENRFAQQFLTMFHLPTDVTQLLLGNSLTGREEGYYVPSDVGYVLTIYGLGLVGQLLMLLPILIGIYASVKIYKAHKQYALLAIIVLSSYLVLNVKELALMTRTVWPVICVFLSISIIEYHSLRKRQDEDKKARQAA